MSRFRNRRFTACRVKCCRTREPWGGTVRTRNMSCLSAIRALGAPFPPPERMLLSRRDACSDFKTKGLHVLVYAHKTRGQEALAPIDTRAAFRNDYAHHTARSGGRVCSAAQSRAGAQKATRKTHVRNNPCHFEKEPALRWSQAKSRAAMLRAAKKNAEDEINDQNMK